MQFIVRDCINQNKNLYNILFSLFFFTNFITFVDDFTYTQTYSMFNSLVYNARHFLPIFRHSDLALITIIDI